MKWIKRFILLALLTAAGTWAYGYFNPAPDEQPTYRTEKISRGDIRTVVSASGTLNPAQLVTVGAQVSGKIEKLYIKANDHVTAGQLLAEIDPALIVTQLKQDETNLETARSSFELSQRDLERTRMLVAKDYVAKTDLERAQQAYLSAKNGYEAAKSAIERDKVNLSYAKITAPIDGTIIAQNVTEGQTLQASFQTPELFKIAGDLGKMKIDVNYSEADINKIKLEMPVTFTVNAYPDRPFTGVVKDLNLNPANSGQGVVYGVRVDVENNERILKPGMTAAVSVILAEKKDILRTSQAALRFKPPVINISKLDKMLGKDAKITTPATDNLKPDQKIIYLYRNETVVPVIVDVGVSDDVFVEISGKDINDGDLAIIGVKKTRKQ